ncbi:hypothetical protein [Halostella salina]|uniref:hypothetical protein n=1 Tax=Halostella salina TaxID=1547897 RepID=UPI000EF7BFA3|nr:hypothetical protein [Halostella salina]
MVNERTVSRRHVLSSGVALSAALAGCTGGSGSDGTETATDADTDTDTDTETATATETTADPGPTLDEFEYPAGASRDGVDGTTLFGTHESTLTGAGTLTVEGEITRELPGFSATETMTKKIGSDGIAGTIESGDLTESLWSPDDESVAYVQMAAGFEERYRIDNESPQPRELAELRRFRGLLNGAAWGEALEVVEGPSGYAVTYEATGIADENALLQVAPGESVSEVEARITVTQSGYVREVGYDISVARGSDTVRQDAVLAVGSVGDTTVPEPEWADTAREEGVRFERGLTSDGRAVELEMVNGTEISADARTALSDRRGRGEGQLSEPLAEGDRLFLALSDSGELLTARDGVPEGARQLEAFARATIRYRAYPLLVTELQL